jgi:hypothetical protein
MNNFSTLGKDFEKTLQSEVDPKIVQDNYNKFKTTCSTLQTYIVGLCNILDDCKTKLTSVWSQDFKKFNEDFKKKIGEFSSNMDSKKVFAEQYKIYNDFKTNNDFLKFCIITVADFRKYSNQYKDEFSKFVWLSKLSDNARVIIMQGVSKACAKYLWINHPAMHSRLASIFTLINDSFGFLYNFKYALDISKENVYKSIVDVIELLENSKELKGKLRYVGPYIRSRGFELINGIDDVYKERAMSDDSTGWIVGIFNLLGKTKKDKMPKAEEKHLELEFRMLQKHMMTTAKPPSNIINKKPKKVEQNSLSAKQKKPSAAIKSRLLTPEEQALFLQSMHPNQPAPASAVGKKSITEVHTKSGGLDVDEKSDTKTLAVDEKSDTKTLAVDEKSDTKTLAVDEKSDTKTLAVDAKSDTKTLVVDAKSDTKTLVVDAKPSSTISDSADPNTVDIPGKITIEVIQ